MKTITIIVWFATAALLQAGSLAGGSVLSVTKSPDKHALRICYEVAGHTNQQTLVLTNEIDDYCFCRFVGNSGVAFALSDTESNIYWSTSYFSRLDHPIYPFKIRAPVGYRLAGVTSTQGDEVMVTALNTCHEPEVMAKGWVYLRECPRTPDVIPGPPTNTAGGVLKEFEVPYPKPEKAK
jgi:hypothetical protein